MYLVQYYTPVVIKTSVVVLLARMVVHAPVMYAFAQRVIQEVVAEQGGLMYLSALIIARGITAHPMLREIPPGSVLLPGRQLMAGTL